MYEQVQWRMVHGTCSISQKLDRRKLVSILESTGQIYSETSLTFGTAKCSLPSVINISKLHIFMSSIQK